MKRAIFGGLVALLVLANVPLLRAEAPADPAEWVPSDALVYIGVTDLGRTWEDFQSTASYKLMSDPAMTKSSGGLGMFGAAMAEVKARLSKALNVDADALQNPFKGGLAFFLTGRPGTGPDRVQPGLVAGVGDEAVLQQYLDKLSDKLKETHRHSEASADGTTIHVFTAEEKAESEPAEKDEFADFDKDEPSATPSPEKLVKEALDKAFSAEELPKQFAYCVSNGRLIVAGNEEQVRTLLGKPASTLADSEDYRVLVDKLKPLGTVRIVGNLPKIIEMQKADGSTQEKEWLRILGAESLRSVVGHLRVGASSYDGKFELLFLMRSDRAGLAKLLSMDNVPTAPPAFIGADTWMYMGLNLNVPTLLEQVEQMVRASDAGAAEKMRGFLEATPTLGQETVNSRKELLEHLGGPLCVDLSVAKPYGPDTARLMITLGHRDAEAVGKFLGHFPQVLVPREAQGTQIFDIALPLPGLMGNAIAVGPDRIVIGKSATIEEALTAAAAPLAETPEFRRAARFVPEQAWMTFYTDGRKMMEAALEVVKQQGAAMTMDPALAMLTNSLTSILPEPDKADPQQVQALLKHQSSAIMTIATTPEGVQMTWVTLRPAEATGP